MKPLRTTQFMLTWYGLLQNENSTSWQKFAYELFGLINLILIVIHCVASAAFVMNFIFIDLEIALFGVSQICAFSPIVYMSLVTLLLRRRTTALIEEVTVIFNSIDEPGSKRLILEADSESEWIWKMYIKYGVVGCCIGSIVPGAIFILWSLHTYGDLNTDRLYHQFAVTLPWNTRTPLGYFGEFLFCICACEVYLVFVGTIILTFVSLCLYHRTFYRIFQYSLQKLDDCANENDQRTILCDLIRFHNTAKSLFFHSAEIWSHFILIVLLFTTLALACIVFQMDLGIRHFNTKTLFLPIPFTTLNFNMFMYTYYGSMATESYENMAQSLFETKWLKLPNKLQKMLITMIQNTQQPLYYHGFGIFILNLETYGKLMKLVFSYYMIQKSLTNQS